MWGTDGAALRVRQTRWASNVPQTRIPAALKGSKPTETIYTIQTDRVNKIGICRCCFTLMAYTVCLCGRQGYWQLRKWRARILVKSVESERCGCATRLKTLGRFKSSKTASSVENNDSQNEMMLATCLKYIAQAMRIRGQHRFCSYRY